MLVLSRKSGESVVITTPEGREIKVTLIQCSSQYGPKARLAFAADPDVVIDREEVHKRKGTISVEAET